MKKCEKCGAKPKSEYALLDYCAMCSKDLCAVCMALGCCGHAPARSGMEADDSGSPTAPDDVEDQSRL